MDDEQERPGLFNRWPSITFINCPACATHWVKPRFGSAKGFFPPDKFSHDDREAVERAYCPGCGCLLPTVGELETDEYVVGRSPIHGKPFVGTLSGIQAFLDRSQGGDVQLWRYDAGLSNLILKIDSTTDDTHAFVVCIGTQTLVLPTLHWRSSLLLQSTNNPDCWELRDSPAGVRIVCAAVGVFYDITSLW